MPQTTTPDPQQITALLISSEWCDYIDFPRTNTVESLYELVEDDFERISVLSAVHIWFGENSRDRRSPNDRATVIVRALLDDAVAGRFDTSPDERRAVGHALLRPHHILPIFGPCLITGVDAGYDPDSVPAVFQTWWNRTSADVSALHDDRLHQRARTALRPR